jgi:GNAT superfamily N-acetyltransferase|tara:strand:+ start:185 stop:715 length:531 start_codon:yes stop_codon:yes gene_type:complete
VLPFDVLRGAALTDQTVTYFLEMTAPSQLRAKPIPNDLLVSECEIKQFHFNQFLYRLIGAPWQWTERLDQPDEVWQQEIEDPNHRTWVAYHRGAIAGYYELRRQGDDVEILYFGLEAAFFGRGFGGGLLSHATSSAWEWAGTRRVWVHTCTLDHLSALQNYQARGFTLYDTQIGIE